jgi:hypothetical protein
MACNIGDRGFQTRKFLLMRIACVKKKMNAARGMSCHGGYGYFYFIFPTGACFHSAQRPLCAYMTVVAAG